MVCCRPPQPACDGVTRIMQPPRHNMRGHAVFPHRRRRHRHHCLHGHGTPRPRQRRHPVRRPPPPPRAAGRGRGTHGARALADDGLCHQEIGGGVARRRRQGGGGCGRGRWRGREGCGSAPPTHGPQGAPMAGAGEGRGGRREQRGPPTAARGLPPRGAARSHLSARTRAGPRQARGAAEERRNRCADATMWPDEKLWRVWILVVKGALRARWGWIRRCLGRGGDHTQRLKPAVQYFCAGK